jgi:type IV pilus assembly protein PilQ
MYREKNSKDKAKIRNKLFVWCIVLVVMSAIAVADVAQEPTKAYALANTGAAGTETSGSQAGVSADGKLNFINFDREKCKSIKDALRILGALYKKNIVPSPNVDGPLTVTRLYDVTFEQAMDAILSGIFKYEQKGNLIEVFPRGDVSRMKHAVFALNYISAAEAQKLIMPVLSDKGTVGVTSPAVTGVPTGESISAPKGGDTMSLKDTIVVFDYAENIAEAEKVISLIDVRPIQVLIEATILSATLNEDMELGVDLNFLAGVHLDGTSTTVEVGGANAAALETTIKTPIQQIAAGTPGAAPIETFGFARIGGNGLRVGVTSGDVSAFITALESVTDTTILANPKILAVNKQLGQVYIGTKIGYISQTTQTQTSTTQQVAFLDTGTKLSFRPYIGDDGYIRMDIHPKDSTGTLKTNDIPDEFSTELATNVMVQSGQTIVIGGLFRDVVITSRSQIPLLGDLPLIGALFRGTSDQTTRQEVIVLLTPHIIEEPEETSSEARIDDVRRKRYGARDELQWAGRARLVEDRYAIAARHYVEGDIESAIKELTFVLEVRPTYLEAIRLKERIIAETTPDEVDMIERIMLENVEREDSDKWQRR